MDLLTRRNFNTRAGKFLLLVLGAGPSMFMTGCSVIDDIIHFVPVINAALSTISTVLGMVMPVLASTIIGVIEAALSNLQAAAIEYKAAPVTSKDTFLHRLETFLGDVGDNFQSLLSALSATGPIPAIVVAILELVISTISHLAGKLVALGGKPANVTLKLPMTLKAGNQSISTAPVQRSVAQFKAEFNHITASNGHPEVKIY